MDSKSGLIRYIEILLDMAVMFVSYLLALQIKFGSFSAEAVSSDRRYLTLYIIEMFAYLVVFFVFFDSDNLISRNIMSEIVNLVKMYAYIIAFVSVIIYFTKTAEYYSRGQMVCYFVISFFLVLLERQWLKRLLTKTYHRSGANEKIMLVTTSDYAESVMRKIKETRNWYFRISSIAIIDKSLIGEEINKVEVKADENNILDIVATEEIDSVFLCLPWSIQNQYKEFVEDVRKMGKTVHVNINEYDTHEGNRRLEYLGKFAVVSWPEKKYRIRHMVLRRFVDIVMGLIGSIFMAVFGVLFGIGHLCERDWGNTYVRLVRVGKNGRRFYLYKFRVVHQRTKEISATGKVIRCLHLEYWPEIWNVLWGDMSLIGAVAPSLPEFLDYTREKRKELSLKPGIFGRKFEKKIDLNDEKKYLEEWLSEQQPLIYSHTELEKKHQRSPLYLGLKRSFDIISSLLGLVVLSPILLLLGILVKWEDGGRIFYGHTRVGYGGKKITVYKFRSMRMNIGDLTKILTPEQLEQYEKEFKIDNDPRITRIGNVLRKTSLDELPQLINILKGDLSVVGPRPIVPVETEIYGADVEKLLSVKPGLTGYWQAYARNNATYESGERQKMEMFYVENRSLWLDIKILFRTVISVLKRDGAE